MKLLPEEKKEILDMIVEACASGARKEKACKLLHISARTCDRWRVNGFYDKRKGALKRIANKLSKEEKQNIINVSCNEEYRNLPPEKIVPMLANKGEYVASESTFRRVLKESGLLIYRGESKPKSKNSIIPEAITTGKNQVWSWDITYLKTDVNGRFYYLYLIMDVWSRLIVGHEVYEEESGDYSAALMRKTCMKHSIEKEKLILHSDNGSPMKCATMLATLNWLGVNPTFSRPSVSNDNAYSESLFKTLKYKSGYPKCFKTIEDANFWVDEFVNWYNNEHLHSEIKYVTPKQRHEGNDIEILENRKVVYENARMKNPQRWPNGKIRNWEWQEKVILNPKTTKEKARKTA